MLNISAVVIFINVLRAMHRAPPLIPTQKLNYIAGNWSTYMARSGRFDHSFSPYGENIAQVGSPDNHTQAAILAVKMAYAESAYWNKSNPTVGVGHFTQLVWFSSRYVGIGVANNSRRRTYVTFEFDPPGNVLGYYAYNVF